MKILFVDDSAFDIELEKRELEHAGMRFAFETASSEAEFTKKLEVFAPDIVLCDHALPGFNSVKALSITKEAAPGTVFILVTGTLSEEFAVQSIKAGASDYVLKSNLKRLPVSLQKAIDEKNHARNLAEKEAFISLIVESLPIVHYIVEADTFKVAYMSPNVNRITGFEADDFLTDNTLWRSRVHPMHQHLINKNTEDLLSRNNFVREYLWKTADGSYKWFLDRISLTRKNGKDYMTGAWIDIHEQKLVEEKLSSKVKELDAFLYRASHDLKSPVTSIEGIIRLAALEVKDETAKKFCGYIEQANSKMSSVIDSLVEVSTVNQEQFLESEVDLQDLIMQVLAKLPRPGDYNVSLVVKDREASRIVSDRSLLSSVFEKLIDNAYKYRSPRNNQKLVITLGSSGNNIHIVFHDQGKGIRKEDLPKIFDMFYRADDSVPGNGLGLYIVRVAMEKLGGIVDVKSIRGQGSVFTLQFPLSRNSEGETESPPGDPQARR
jgi:PAS domain S-box-containing protein